MFRRINARLRGETLNKNIEHICSYAQNAHVGRYGVGNMKRLMICLLMSLYALNLSADPSPNPYPGGTIWKKASKHPFVIKQGIRYLKASKTYKMHIPDISIRLVDVEKIEINKPESMNEAIALAKKTNAKAIPLLKKIIEDYRMLQWDQEAARWLAEIYIKRASPAKVIQLFEMDWYFLPPNKEFEKLYIHALRYLGQNEKADAFIKKVEEREKKKTITNESMLQIDSSI